MAGGGGKGGGGSSTGTSITLGGTTEVDSDVEIHGLDNIKTDSNIKTDNTSRLVLSTPEPLKSEFAITKPIVTDSTGKLGLDANSALTLDVRPLVSDACVKLELGRLPPTRVRQPYETHFGMTFFGVEIFGFNACGTSEVTVEDSSRRATHFTTPVATRPAPHASGGVVRIRLGD